MPGGRDWDKIAKALKPVCQAPTEEAALERFVEFADTWGKKYPAIVRPWENAWAEFVRRGVGVPCVYRRMGGWLRVAVGGGGVFGVGV